MLKVTYKLTVGSWSINSDDDPRTEFVALETHLSMDSPMDSFRVSLYAPCAAPGGPLAGAAGALGGGTGQEGFSVQIRGNDVAEGDRISIQLTNGDLSETVMTAEVQSIDSCFGRTRIIGKTGVQKMTNTCINQVYENQSMSAIISDLTGQADVTTGTIDTGATYPYLVVHESKNLYNVIRELAMAEGMDVYFDIDNKLNIKSFNKTGADHTFSYGTDILDLRVFNHRVSSDHILVYGESPASNQGTDTWHWMAKDLSSFTGEAGDGGKTLSIHSGALRTKDAADTLAASKHGAIKDSSTRGRMTILGNPAVKPGDAVEITNTGKSELDGLFKVTSVSHVLNKREGYLTRIGFTGTGGGSAGLL